MSQCRDKLKPTQPYFVLDTEDFREMVYLKHGISHFFSFRINRKTSLRYVPDGCLNLMFFYDGREMKGFVNGTTLQYSCGQTFENTEVFGIRFMPAAKPAMLDVTMRQTLSEPIPLENVLIGDTAWLYRLRYENDFEKRINIFLAAYEKMWTGQEESTGKKALIQSLKQLVYESNGNVRVADMQKITGYSERYINRVFIDEMGFSPKTFCKIIRFQQALELLNYGRPENMTEAAVRMGYYDQPQFIRDFRKYAGTTPGRYLKLLDEANYRQKIQRISGNEKTLL